MSKAPMRVAVTGAAGQICYSLLFRIAAGDMLGKDQPVILQLLDLPQAQQAVGGVMMELQDCAFPLLAGMIATDDPNVAFKDADICLLVGSRPRTKGMERADLLSANGAIFTVQGKAIAENAKENVKVLVVGNPCNTNALIAAATAKKVGRTDPNNYHSMLRLDETIFQSLVLRTEILCVELDTEAPVGLRDDADGHVRRVAPAVDTTRIPVGHRDGDADILGSAKGGVPGAVKTCGYGRLDTYRLIDDAARERQCEQNAQQGVAQLIHGVSPICRLAR